MATKCSKTRGRFDWIAAEAVFRLLNQRFAAPECDHRCCGSHAIGDHFSCVDCIRQRELFWEAYRQDPGLYVAAVEATLRLPACAAF